MPEPTTPTRLAVLIDADNTSAKHASALLEEVARYGVPTVKRAYGDWTTQNLVGWKDELNRHAITPVQQFSYTTGKNSTDSAMIIDTMDLLYTGNLDAYAIVSSDSDFTRLVTRLRESGKTVYGLGRRRTPTALVAACDKFIFLEVITRGGGAAPDDPDGPAGASAGAEDEPGGDAAPLPDLDTILVAAVEATSGDDNWSRLDAVGSYLSTRHASFDPRNYGFSKLGAMVRAQDVVEVEERTGQPHVRLRAASAEAPAEAPPAPATRPRRTRKSATSGSGGGSGRTSGKGTGGA